MNNWKFPSLTVDKNGNIKLTNYSKKDMCRLNYLAKKQKRNIKGLFVQALLKYIKDSENA